MLASSCRRVALCEQEGQALGFVKSNCAAKKYYGDWDVIYFKCVRAVSNCDGRRGLLNDVCPKQKELETVQTAGEPAVKLPQQISTSAKKERTTAGMGRIRC